MTHFNKMRMLSLMLFIAGSFLMISSVTGITGAIIGLESDSSGFRFISGVMLLASSLLLLITQAREAAQSAEEGVEDIIAHLYGKIEEKRKHHPGNPKYLEGLKDIEEKIRHDILELNTVRNPWVKGAIRTRLEKWNDALDRREDYFFKLPHHYKGVIDLPDRGLYNYAPIGGKKTRMIELRMTHYTSSNAYNKIKRAIESGNEEILFKDKTGWAFFVEKQLPEGLEIKQARTILGTGLQDYVGKEEVRDPQAMLTFTIRVPKERVVSREEEYSIGNNETCTVKKYAIAGGISSSDIVKTKEIVGEKYRDKGHVGSAKKQEQLGVH